MRKNIFKVVIIIAVTLLILIGIMYLIDWNRMKKGKEVVFGTWGEKYSPVQNIDENEEKDLKRIKKKSFYWYKDVIQSNGEKIAE